MKLGFIGCGNMGSAIMTAIVSSKTLSSNNVYVYDAFKPTMDKVCNDLKVNPCNDANEVVKSCDVVFLAVKPNIIKSVLQSLDESLLESDTLLVSIAAGKDLNYIASSLTYKNRIVRVMPNINAIVGEAMSAYCANDIATKEDKEIVSNLMNSAGKVMELDESYFPLFGVTAGCSPAFVYMFIDALARAGVKNGMKKADALKIAAQSVYGSAKMIMESSEHPWELVDRVCSPGGTTIEGVLSLKDDGFESAIQHAVDKAVEKDKLL